MFTGKNSNYRFTSFIIVLCILFSAIQPVTVFARSGDSLERKSSAEWMPARPEPVQQDQDVIPTDTLVPTETPLPTETPVPVETSLPVDVPAAQSIPSPDIVGPLAVTTWYVATTGNDLNSCTAIGFPCLTINGAIGKAAASGDMIKVAVGTYTGTGTEVVLVNKSVTLSGGWNAAFTTQTETSTIDGQSALQGIEVSNGVTVTVNRFTIQNGFTNMEGGGGVFNDGGILTLNNNIISNNVADGGFSVSIGGGGIYNQSGTLILNNSSISGNSADGAGGGIAGYNGSITLSNSALINNNAGSTWCGVSKFKGELK